MTELDSNFRKQLGWYSEQVTKPGWVHSEFEEPNPSITWPEDWVLAQAAPSVQFVESLYSSVTWQSQVQNSAFDNDQLF